MIGCQTITVNPTTIPNGTAGSPYTQTFTQTSGIGTITWSVTGTLPTGHHARTARTGVLSGTPTQIGSFPITITATDANGCTGTRAYTLVINAAGPFVPTALLADDAGNKVFEAGETAIVAPTWRNDTGAPQPLTGIASLFTGPGTSTYTITDSTANYGATVAAGATSNCSTASGDCYGFSVSVPSPRPAMHWDSTYKETLSSGDVKTWTLHLGDSFTDVPRQQRRSTASSRRCCTARSRAAARARPTARAARRCASRWRCSCWWPRRAPATSRPRAPTPIFSDVPASSPFCKFIEELSRRGVVTGMRRRQLLPARRRDARADGGVRAAHAGPDAEPAGLHDADVRRRAGQQPLLQVDRGAGAPRGGHGLRRRQLLPRRSR